MRVELSARRARDRREPFVCRNCRRPAPRVTEAHRRYWLERFTLEEIREMAAALFGSF